MIDLRYHVYSLAAVFFALALGIVIGTSFSRLAPGSKSERKTILRYADSMRSLRDQIELVSKNIDRNERVISELDAMVGKLEPNLLRGKLAYRNVAIIQTGDYDQTVTEVQKALEEAGAQVTSIIDISRSYDVSDQSKVSQALTNAGIMIYDQNQSVEDRLVQFLSDAVCEGRPEHMLNKLESEGIATFRGNFSKPCNLVVVTGGSESADNDTSDQLNSLLVKHLRRPNVVVVGCEPSDCEVSYIMQWHRLGIASVDNTDWASGRVSLVYALLGEKARFGIKDTSDQVVPKRLEMFEQ